MSCSLKVVGFIVLNIYLATSPYNHVVDAVKFELDTIIPNSLRKAKQGFDIIFRRAPPKVVIPPLTGIGKLDVFLFHSMQIGDIAKNSLSSQCNTLTLQKFTIPNIFLIALSSIPADQLGKLVSKVPFRTSDVEVDSDSEERKSFAIDRIQQIQSIFKALLSCQIAQIMCTTLKDVIMQYVSKVNPTVEQVLEALPQKYIPIATAMLIAQGLMKRYDATILSSQHSESSFTVKVTPIDNEIIATTMTIDVVENESIVVTNVAQDAQYNTVPVPISSETTSNEETPFEVNVTKISAVLDRFESKILSLVGGTRFHPTPSMTDAETEQEETAESTTTSTTNTDITCGAPQTKAAIEVTQLCCADVVEVVQDDEHFSLNVEDEAGEESSVDSENSFFTPSLKSYEILPTSSSPLSLSNLSKNAAVRAIGVMTCALFSIHVLPPYVRYTVAVVAGAFLLHMVVREVREIISKRFVIDSFESLVQDIEERSLSHINDMEALVVETLQGGVDSVSTSQSKLRFWATRLPILDGITNFSNQIASSWNRPNVEDILDTDESVSVIEDESVVLSTQLESSVEYYKEPEEEVPQTISANAGSINTKFGWSLLRGKVGSPKMNKSEMTRTACAAIIGM